MKTPRILLLTLCALAGVSLARATTVIPPTFDELVGKAEFIFQGTVTDVKSQWAGEGGQRHIISYVTFKVEEAIKGEAGVSYTLRMLGGTVGDETMAVTDSPKFIVGDRDILFVENNGKQFMPLVGIMHGRFRLQKDGLSGVDKVSSEHGEPVRDLVTLGQEEKSHKNHAASVASSPQEGLGGGDFKAAIKAKLAAVK